MNSIDLSGIWQCDRSGQKARVRLPGTLDENGIGSPDDPARQWQGEEVRRMGFWKPGDPIVTRLTRRYTFEGQAVFSRVVTWDRPGGARVFLDVERARHLRLYVNGHEVSPVDGGSLSAPWRFEVTDRVTGRDEVRFLSDNTYPSWPGESIQYASAASDETQTNWLGLLGFLRLRTERAVFLSDLRVYPEGEGVRAEVEIDADRPWRGEVRLSGEVLEADAVRTVEAHCGRQTFSFSLRVRADAARWDLGEGNLHRLTASAPGLEEKSVRFGLRAFRAEEGHLTLNGRRIFLRCETNCAVFPETGHPPMDRESWRKILAVYRDYGVNCVRFHSHCPPEAAFEAADEMGLMMQPELSNWDPKHAFASPEARAYYARELQEILRHLSNHPSFVMLTFGNELQADEAGHAFMDSLLEKARETDPTRLYARSSNPHYGERGAFAGDDFYTAMRYGALEMRAACDGVTGWLNEEYPNARHAYDEAVRALRADTDRPVFSFEVGQYEVLPDFGQVADYRGVTRADNLAHMRSRVLERGLEDRWRAYAEATGESSLQCYRAEVEAALRTEGYSGISLLGLQDFPGQGTALVGMTDAHLTPKPFSFASPERFRAFFRDALPLVLLERFTYSAGEEVTAKVLMANYGPRPLAGRPQWSLEGPGGSLSGALEEACVPAGSLKELGTLRAPLGAVQRAARLTLRMSFAGIENVYPLWVYPEETPRRPAPVTEARSFDQKTREVLRAGGTVYLSPDSTAEAIPRSVQAQFSPDFWSVCTFPKQPGGMGQYIHKEHPLFEAFPTDTFNTWQWWPMAVQRAMLLPGDLVPIIAEMDSCAYLRPMAKLFECRCGSGRLLVSSLSLHRLQRYPEARALQRAIYAYLDSEKFRPAQEVSPEGIAWIFGQGTEA